MRIKSLFYIFLERLLALVTDKIVCISEAEKVSAMRNKITPKEKLYLIPNGIDIASVQQAKAKSRRELGISEDAFVVGMIGRLSPQKAPDTFIKSAKLIRKEIKNAVFIIVGDGEETSQIKEYAEINKLPLIITGWTDEPYSYLKVFDVALLLSRWEGFGLAIVEYMAAEKNVIASRVDAIPTLIEHGEDGLLVDVDNPEAVKEGVLFYYNNPEKAVEMSKRALQKVKHLYSIDRVVEQHTSLFNELVNK